MPSGIEILKLLPKTNCGDCGQVCDTDEVCVQGECRGFIDSRGCAACPCDNCHWGFDECCTYPGQANIICVDGGQCPAP